MRIYNKYIISLAVAALLINTFLAALGHDDLGMYFTTNAIAYLIITLLYVHLNPRARRALNATSAILFAGFMGIVAFKVIEILGK